MRRGFKSQTERLSDQFREELGCGADEPVPLDQLAKKLGARLVPADQLVPSERLEELRDEQKDAFSAVTFRMPSGERIVVHNSLHSEGRTRSNQAHELAHIALDHTLRTLEKLGSMTFLTCDVEQEEEADWLGGCLLLPRSVLLNAARNGMSAQQLAQDYQTSEQMAHFRLNASGVLVQVGRERAAKKRRKL